MADSNVKGQGSGDLGENDPQTDSGDKAAGNKVVVHFRATGDAQILKQSKFKISDKEKFQTVVEYLRKMLKSKSSDPLFLYVNSAFQPSPDETVANLYQCFSLDGKLVINYCSNPAWG